MKKAKSFQIKPADVEKKWLVVDAKDKVLGRLATEVASVLRGKRKPTFTPHVDCGDSVIVLNAEHIKLTGNKWDQKKYYSHSRFVGSLKEITARKQLEKKPEDLIFNAVKGMLPKTSLGRKQLRNLRVYTGDQHNHAGQSPEPLNA